MTDAILYTIDPMQPFPKYWHDHISNLRVMAGPIEGYLMVRRPVAVPFCLSMKMVLNADRHPEHGPFTIGKAPK